MEPLRVALPLGIGDCHWVCTKLRGLSEYHGGRPIHAYVNSSPHHASIGYLKLVPFIEKAVQSRDAPYDVWQELHPHRDHRWSTLEGSRNWRGFDYVLVANGHLERGERLETWLPELPTDFRYPLIFPQESIDRADALCGSVLLYLSGTGPNYEFHRNSWSLDHWVAVIRLFNKRGIAPVIVGADTADDRGFASNVLSRLAGAAYLNLVGTTSVADYVAIIQTARCWIGLNSGGGIVSAMLGTPTVMFWSDSKYPSVGNPNNPMVPLHTNMRYSWLAPEYQQLNSYRAFSYGSPELTPDNVAECVSQWL